MKKIVLLIVMSIFVISLSACNVDNSPYRDDNDNKVNDNQEEEDDQEEPETMQLTLSELSMYDGKDGNKAYIAVDGVIYDVTNRWSNGTHNGIDAGNDVTGDISRAPHGRSILTGLTVVGELIE